MRSFRSRAAAGLIATVALIATGCSSSGSGGGTAPAQSQGTPHRGGTLVLLGQSDIFNLDPVSAYYTVSTLLERTFARQLFTYPAAPTFPEQIKLVPDVATVVPTTANGGISADGKTYTIHLRPGVDWNTSPARQVTAADFVRELRFLCNPQSPVGAPSYFTTTIVGMADYCAGFAKVKPTIAAVDHYATTAPLPGASASGALTLVLKLVAPAPDFLNIMAMGFASARPAEYLKYLPDSPQLRANTISDGPYQITNYSAGKSFTLVRNPAWSSATDPWRKAYVNKITITEGLTADSVQQQIQAGTGDMEWDVQPPPQDLPALTSAKDPRLIIGPQGNAFAGFNYITLNQYAGPFKNKLVRQAVAYAINKNAIIQILGGPALGTPASQLIIPGNVGYAPGFSPFSDGGGNGNPAKAKSLLGQAGFHGGPTIKLLYSTTDPAPREAQAMQSSLAAAGFKVTLVPTTQSDFYGKYLEDPTTGKADKWDIALPGWVPDWFGNDGRSTVQPLLTSPGPGSNDFGGYNSPAVNADIAKALAASSQSEAAGWWAKADELAMSDAAMVPVNDYKWPVFHSSRVHGCNFWVDDLNCDPTNVWLAG
ncbi:MAG TPA: ABC transporter substrate-binding protein [Streptosporangiaceae bacterium]|nr:ABC transporter substrate-binding protein [Streptosporangiaceae bacterium]